MPNTVVDRVDLGSFAFDCGETVPSLHLAYETYGTFRGDNAVLVAHALTGSSHAANRRDPAINVELPPTGGQAAAWWADVVGPGKPIDTDEYYVIVPNHPGSCYGSTGPASTNPETGSPYGPAFPAVTVGDWVEAQRQLLTHLGVDRLHAVVGGSVGGMNVLEWLKRYPDVVDRGVPIAAAPRVDAQTLALNAVAKRAITSDPDWQGGNYYSTGQPTKGLALARQLGHIKYLSAEAMEQRFGRSPARVGDRFDLFQSGPSEADRPYRDVESYLDYNAKEFVKRFDANSYFYLLDAMDSYDLAAGYDDDAAALAGFTGEVLVVSITGDWHFTTEQSASLTDAFARAGVSVTHHRIDSDYGHDAFLVEPDRIGPPLAEFLQGDSAAAEDQQLSASSRP